MKAIRVPFAGRFLYVPRSEAAELAASEVFATRLYALHRDPHGHVIDDKHAEFRPGLGYDLGSGLVTNVGVMALANDYAWSAQLNLATLALANQHAWGTGSTGAAATDIALGTLAAPTTTAAVAGTQTLVSAANLQKYQSVATITAGGTVAITEWGIHTLNALTASTGTPFTAAGASSWTDTGSVQTASSATVRGLQSTIVVPGTTTVYGLNLSNTTHIGTIVTTGWYKVADGTAGSTPGATEAFVIKPVLWDRKQFAALNLVLNDTVAWTYQLTVASGG
jgi:hypothetical protein